MQVVEQDDRAGSQSRDDRVDRRGRIRARPGVAAVDAPADVEQAELTAEQLVGRLGLVVGRPEEARHRPDGPADRPLRPPELVPRVDRRQARKPRVAPGVVA